MEFAPERYKDTTVTLIQEPGIDFYDTYFLVQSDDGETTRIMIDSDDMRWLWPGKLVRDGKVYFLRNGGRANGQSPYFEPSKGVLFTGRRQMRVPIRSEISTGFK